MKKQSVFLMLCVMLCIAMFAGCMTTHNSGVEDSSSVTSATQEDISSDSILPDSTAPDSTTPDSAVSESASSTGSAQLSINYASSELLAQPGAFDKFIADTSEYQVNAALSTSAVIKQVCVLSLQMGDVSEDGVITFTATELFRLDELTQERPLVIVMTLAGTIPNYGISYLDTDGTQRVYSIGESGYDGSLLLEAITLN